MTVAVGIGSVAILVNDAMNSTAWYRDKLGFEIVGREGHAVFLRPKGSDVLVHLCERCDDWENDRPGGRTGIWLRCRELTFRKDERTEGRIVPASKPEEVEKAYTELKSKGVRFSEELTITSWGTYAILSDPDGNEFELS